MSVECDRRWWQRPETRHKYDWKTSEWIAERLDRCWAAAELFSWDNACQRASADDQRSSIHFYTDTQQNINNPYRYNMTSWLHQHLTSSSSSSSSDRTGPLHQPSPGVSTTASPRPLGVNAKKCAVGDLLNLRLACATCLTTRAGASSYCHELWQCTMDWHVVVKSYQHLIQTYNPPYNVDSITTLWLIPMSGKH